jgi:hypothetical protein
MHTIPFNIQWQCLPEKRPATNINYTLLWPFGCCWKIKDRITIMVAVKPNAISTERKTSNQRLDMKKFSLV